MDPVPQMRRNFMIYEDKPNLEEIFNRQEYKDKGGSISCAHDFWDNFKKGDYGDLFLCNRCHQYFTKVKHLPWVCGPVYTNFTPPKRTNHLNTDVAVVVPVRTTN